VPIAGTLESQKGVGQFSTPICPKGGSLLHADSQQKGKIALGSAKGQFKTMAFLLGRIFFLLTCPLMGDPKNLQGYRADMGFVNGS